MDTQFKDSLTWKCVRGQDELFLFGTVHNLPSDPPQKAQRRFEKCPVAIFETDLLETSQLMQTSNARFLEDKTLPDMLQQAGHGDKWGEVRDILSEYIPGAIVDRIHPWFAQLMIMGHKSPDFQENEPGIDARLFIEASNDQDTRIETLESPEKHLEYIQETGVDAVTELLGKSEKYFERKAEETYSSYLRGDIEGAFNSTIGKETTKLGVQTRNQKWIDQLADLSSPSGAFAAIGVFHFMGDEGLFQLLRERGFKINKV